MPSRAAIPCAFRCRRRAPRLPAARPLRRCHATRRRRAARSRRSRRPRRRSAATCRRRPGSLSRERQTERHGAVAGRRAHRATATPLITASRADDTVVVQAGGNSRTLCGLVAESARDAARLEQTAQERVVTRRPQVKLDLSKVSAAQFAAARSEYHRHLQDEFFAAHRIAGTDNLRGQARRIIVDHRSAARRSAAVAGGAIQPRCRFQRVRPGTTHYAAAGRGHQSPVMPRACRYSVSVARGFAGGRKIARRSRPGARTSSSSLCSPPCCLQQCRQSRSK